MPAPISLADHRARRLVARLLEIQERLEDADAPSDPSRAETLFEELSTVLDDLARTAPLVRTARLRTAIERACAAHDRWWRAVATETERAAVRRYLRSVDALVKAAGASARPR